mmetsp:Transcript_26617/g.60905  ORF Transcript_26617/g.60905 Transcript_26617/m.60905 type:complete len:84 (-) Transcript_26617:176-427(-)
MRSPWLEESLQPDARICKLFLSNARGIVGQKLSLYARAVKPGCTFSPVYFCGCVFYCFSSRRTFAMYELALYTCSKMCSFREP